MDNSLEPNNNSNIFYDSLEDSKNQESYSQYNQMNNLTPYNSSNKKYNSNKFNKKYKNENSKINEKIKKVFQIPKNKYLNTPINKKEKNEKESPKFSCTEIPLYYDYSTHSSNTKNQSLIKKNNSSLNINNEKTFFIINNLNQNTNKFNEDNSKRDKIKEIKINKIPNSYRQNEIKSKNKILSDKRRFYSYRENNKNNNSYNFIIDKNNSSNKKIVNKLFHNNSKKKDKKLKSENTKKLQNNLKKEIGLKDLILNSSFSEKNKEIKDKKIEINKINLLLKKFDKNENFPYDYDMKILKENEKEFKNIDNKNNEIKNIENFDIDINNNSQKTYISTSLRNNPSLTNYDNYIDTGSFCPNYNNDNINNNDYEIYSNKLDNNNDCINYNNNNNDNIFTLNVSYNKDDKNDFCGSEQDLGSNLFIKNYNLNDNIETDSSYERLENTNKSYIYNSYKMNLEQIQYERYNNLYNLLYDFLKWELILENIKINLASREDINIHLLFEIFDTKKRKSISLSDIFKTLINFGMNINEEEIKYILLQNNKKLKERFNFEEFCDIILPNNKIKRKEINERKVNDMRGLSDKTINIICFLFQKIIEGERSNEFYRNNLAIVPESSGFDLFNLLKKNYSVGIYKEDIDIFFSSRGKVFFNNETELIMKKLDKNKDGVVDYTEFLTEITPKFFY